MSSYLAFPITLELRMYIKVFSGKIGSLTPTLSQREREKLNKILNNEILNIN